MDQKKPKAGEHPNTSPDASSSERYAAVTLKEGTDPPLIFIFNEPVKKRWDGHLKDHTIQVGKAVTVLIDDDTENQAHHFVTITDIRLQGEAIVAEFVQESGGRTGNARGRLIIAVSPKNIARTTPATPEESRIAGFMKRATGAFRAALRHLFTRNS